MRTSIAWLCTVACLCFVSGCSGGGGGSAPPVSNPPPPPTNGPTKPQAYRLLNQASFGATEVSAQQVTSIGYEAWIDAQLTQPASVQLPTVLSAYAALPQPIMGGIGQLHNDRVGAWFANSVRGGDQLRQRVAFALSEIMVVSQVSLQGYPFGVADYYDTLARNAFGDFRTLLGEVTLHPMMGVYLSMLGNQKPNTALNIRPDENYAREAMQLFTIGLVELNIDGTPRLDTQGQPIATYDQATIEGFAHVFTGWNWSGGTSFRNARPTLTNQSMPMQAYAEQHDTDAKRVLTYPGAALTTIPAGQTAAKDLADALDNIAAHPNVGPFIAKQLIQRLVTSNPTPQYVERVARKFNDDGRGRRGNLAAVVKAILLDTEARDPPTGASNGKLKEPLLRLTQLWRAYDASAADGSLNAQGATLIFGQGPLQANSVFNFFSPFYAPPGEIAAANLVAPELQIATEYQNTQVTNYLFLIAHCYIRAPITGCPAVRATVPIINTTEEDALANDPPALVERVAQRLLAGQISPTLRAETRTLVERAPASPPTVRTAQALYLIASSPEFALQQ